MEYGLDVDTGLFRHADFTTKDCPKLFTNPNEVWKTYMDENGRTMGITPSYNFYWEQFKMDVKKAMDRIR